MKKLLLMTVLLLSAAMAEAQTARLSLGLKGTAAAVLPRTEIAPTVGIESGGGGGIFAGLRIYDRFGFQAELLYGCRSATFVTDFPVSRSLRSDCSYLFVPLVVQGWIHRNVAIELGYEQAVVLSGRLSDGYYMKDDPGVLDYGSLVAGINLNLGRLLFLNLRYSLAVTGDYVMTTRRSKEMGFTLGVGLRLFNSKRSVFEK